MRNTLKNRIISGFMVLSLVTSTFAPAITAFGEGDPEASLYEVMSDNSGSAEVKVLSSSDESDIEVVCATETDAEIGAKEGLEVLENYVISDREENSDETLWVEADQDANAGLQPEESMSIYSVEDERIDDVIIEDIAEENHPCEIESDVTGLALVKDSGYRHLNFELDSVTLDGMMPKNATAEAVDVTEMYSDAEADSDTEGSEVADASSMNATSTDADVDSSEGSIIAAYDITIKDGEAEYQPSSDRPIDVAITNPEIKSDSDLRVFHIKDDGTKEEITDFSVEDGKVSFSAVGFSVYEIVEGIPSSVVTGWHKLKNINDVQTYADKGIYISSASNKNGYHFATNYTTIVKDNRYGITKTKGTYDVVDGNVYDANGAVNDSELFKAVPFYFEDFEVSQSDNKTGIAKIYCFGTDGSKQYIKNEPDNSMVFVSDSTQADTFTVKFTSNNKFTLKGKTNYFNEQNGNGWGSGNTQDGETKSFAGDAKATDLYLYAYDALPNDAYKLDGKTFGLMYYADSVGNALMVDRSGNVMTMMTNTIRTSDNNNKTVFVTDDNVTSWTFHKAGENKYYISTQVGADVKYLMINGSKITLSDTMDSGSEFTVIPDTNNRIKLKSNDKYVIFDGGSFKAGTNTSKASLNFIDVAEINNTDKVTYYAKKISVSEAVDGEKVVIYTRVWDETKKVYDYYAIDHDGTVFRCFERGDNIMWTGNPICTTEWVFTEYTYDDGTPNNYYELQNDYSKLFIAPQVKNGQVLSDSKIGINMEGRGYNQYYSTIVAWDDPNYAYAGLKVEKNGNKMILKSCPLSDADTFWFASLKDVVPTLTEVETIDNSDYGIAMKIIDFGKRIDQSSFLGSNEGGAVKTADLGLLSTDIPEGSEYPTTALASPNPKSKKSGDFDPDLYVQGRSLGELFAGAYEVDNLFIKSTYEATGYFEFDSSQNFATLQGNEFKVYNELGTSDAKSSDSMKHGQFMPFNTITAGKYSKLNPQNLYDSLLKSLPETDPRKYEYLHLLNETPNYYNGVELTASFVQTPSGKDAWGHDIIFEFTGDDDFWLYVDNELVIDLGGIHSALGGNVNFATGDVTFGDFSKDGNGKKTDLRTLFEDNYRQRNSEATDQEVNEYLSKYFKDGEKKFKDYTSHTMRIFYMERGAGASNLHMRFNLSYVNPASVMLKKEVTGSDDIDFKMVEYPFQIWYVSQKDGQEKLLTRDDEHVSVVYQNSPQRVKYKEEYTPPNCSVAYPSVFFLNPDMTAEIQFPDKPIKYRIVEVGVNSEVYDKVLVNDVEITGKTIDETTRKSYDSGSITAEDRPSVTFENHVDQAKLRTLTFKKRLLDEEGHEISDSEDPTLFSFRLWLSNGVDDTLNKAQAAKYCVQNPDGFLCKWDSENQKFVATSYKDYADINNLPDDTPEQQEEKKAAKASVTFNTSFNGAISKIPAYYTVLVPNLTAGTRFKVEENFNEIPIGYGRTQYNREEGTYYVEGDDPVNVGRIRLNESPRVDVTNKRGYGLQVNKVWSDQKYTKSHENIYFAVYVGNSDTPLPNTVRMLQGSYVRYFFDGLQQGCTLSDYHVYEVKVTNPGKPDDDGVISSYTSVEKIANGATTTINAVPSSSQDAQSQPFDYVVSYKEGDPYPCMDGFPVENARTDTVTNTRTDGVVLNLYDMKTKETLSGGTFTLRKSDGTKLGTFTSDSKGRITILYDMERGVDYILEETKAPKGYIGLPNEIKFRLDDNDEVTIDPNENEEEWQNGHKLIDDPEKLIAQINVYNKPYKIQVYKYDKSVGEQTGQLGGAKFALYKGFKSGIGVVIKGSSPMPGYENLITDTDGCIPDIDTELEPGRYFLTEIEAPPGYKGVSGDIVFEITDKDGLIHISSPANSDVVLEESENQNEYEYFLKIPNVKDSVPLTITKTVTGNMGNKVKDFEFTFTTKAGDTTEYTWTKNGTEQPTKLKTGDPFTLKHGEEVVITVPAGTKVTISEDAKDYTASFKLNDSSAVTDNKLEFTVADASTLSVTNTLTAEIPTGIWLPIGVLVGAGVILLLAIIAVLRRSRRYKKYAKER